MLCVKNTTEIKKNRTQNGPYRKYESPIKISFSSERPIMNISFLFIVIQAIYPTLNVNIRHFFACENVVIFANDLVRIPDTNSHFVLFRFSRWNVDSGSRRGHIHGKHVYPHFDFSLFNTLILGCPRSKKKSQWPFLDKIKKKFDNFSSKISKAPQLSEESKLRSFDFCHLVVKIKNSYNIKKKFEKKSELLGVISIKSAKNTLTSDTLPDFQDCRVRGIRRVRGLNDNHILAYRASDGEQPKIHARLLLYEALKIFLNKKYIQCTKIKQFNIWFIFRTSFKKIK
jgi:hypothetical protein